MKIGSLFSGIGGLELGLERAGLGPTIWQVESDPFCRRVLAKHWPQVDRSISDVKAATGLKEVDIICGGFPCQDVSAAGKGAGLAGARSGLWVEFARIVSEMHPGIVVVENVASGKRRWLPFVRRDLRLLGYRTRAFALSAADVGAPHLRRRVFVVAYAERVQLREQSRGSRGANGEGSTFAGLDGEAQSMADADSMWELQSGGCEREQRRWSGYESWWSAESGVGRVAYGVPRGVDRLRALGNAVVPQCAEVIGRIIQEELLAEAYEVIARADRPGVTGAACE